MLMMSPLESVSTCQQVAAGNAEAAKVSTQRNDMYQSTCTHLKQTLGAQPIMTYFYNKKPDKAVSMARDVRHYAYESFNRDGDDGDHHFISSRTNSFVKDIQKGCNNLQPNFRNTEFISLLPPEWLLLSPEAQAQLIPPLIMLWTLFEDREDKGYNKVEQTLPF
jgi:hypothetical protein